VGVWGWGVVEFNVDCIEMTVGIPRVKCRDVSLGGLFFLEASQEVAREGQLLETIPVKCGGGNA